MKEFQINRTEEQLLKKIEQLELQQHKFVLDEINDLMQQSDGVAGLHLNGDVASWDWLCQYGWLDTTGRLIVEMSK